MAKKNLDKNYNENDYKKTVSEVIKGHEANFEQRSPEEDYSKYYYKVEVKNENT